MSSPPKANRSCKHSSVTGLSNQRALQTLLSQGQSITAAAAAAAEAAAAIHRPLCGSLEYRINGLQTSAHTWCCLNSSSTKLKGSLSFRSKWMLKPLTALICVSSSRHDTQNTAVADKFSPCYHSWQSWGLTLLCWLQALHMPINYGLNVWDSEVTWAWEYLWHHSHLSWCTCRTIPHRM